MADRVGIVDVDPTALASSLARLEARVAALEEALATVAAERLPTPVFAPAAAPAPAPRSAPATADPWTVAGTVTLAGRTLVALGGGYLLRALTEGAVLPAGAGVVAGIAYAVLWVVLCVRAAAAGFRISAGFHGLTAALVGFPLLWEATTRFALFDAAAGALVLALFACVLLAAARRAGIEAVAWFGAIGGTASALALAVATSGFIPYAVALAAIGIACLWLGYLEEWVLLRWPVAAAVDLMVLVVTARAVDPDVPASEGATLVLQLFVLALYLGSFVGRSLLLGREVIVFEVVQSAAAMAVCFGGALWLLSSIGASSWPLGLVALALAPAGYAFAFRFADRRHQPRNVAFFSSLALAFVVAGFAIVLPLPAATTLVAILGVACAELGRRSGRLTLSIHALILAVLVAALSGLATLAFTGLFAPARGAWPSLTPALTLALAVVCGTCAWRLPASGPPWLRHALRGFALALIAWLTAGAAIVFLVQLFARPSQIDAGLVATGRTLLLVAWAALLVRRAAAPLEQVWLSYGLLALVGIKLLMEDLMRGRPATLFVALAAYGAALILIPRFARREMVGSAR